MLDRDWGLVRTVGGGEFFDQQVLDVVDATDEAEPRHVVTNASINRSTDYVQAGLRYSF